MPLTRPILAKMLQRRYGMAKTGQKQGGPSQGPKDEPTADRSHQNAQSRDELKDRSQKGDKPGQGRRNGSAKKR
jgi:hypothetical protein